MLTSHLEIQNQILAVSVGIAGTPLSLHYASDRVPGRAAAYGLTIPVGDGGVGAGLKRIELELEVADRVISKRFQAEREGGFHLRWDGRDAEGRPVGGRQLAQVRLGYVYAGILPRSERTTWREQKVALGAWDARQSGLGGWTLSAQHAYDPVGRVLYLGDGSRRTGPALQAGSNGASRGSEAELTIPAEDGSRIDVFDASGRHLRTLHGLTGALLQRLDYDEAGRLIALVDGDGNATRIERDEAGAPTAIVAPFGQRTNLNTDDQGFLTAVTDPLGHAVRCDYAAHGLLVCLTDAEGHSSRYAYDEDGRLVRQEPAGGGSLSLARTRTKAGTKVVVLTALNREYGYEFERLAGGGQERRNRCCATGAFIERVSAEGMRTISYPDGYVETWQSQPDPRLGPAASMLKQEVAKTPGGLTSTVSASRSAVQRRDPSSHEVQVDTVSIKGRKYTTVYSRMDKGALLRRTSPAGRTMSAVLDDRGRLQRVQVEAFQPVSYRYDERGALTGVTIGTGADARTIVLRYDERRHLEVITDPLGRSVRLTCDAVGRVVQQLLPDGREIAYTHDGNGNLLSLTPPARSPHRFSYEPDGLIAKRIPPALDGQPRETRYRYDPERRLSAIERPDGETIELAYDEGGRLSRVLAPRGRIEHAYDPRTGRRRRTTGPGDIRLDYDYDGPLLTREAWSGPVSGAVSRGYDHDFRLLSLAVDGKAASTSFAYDPDGLLVGAGDLIVEHDLRELALGTTLGALLGRRRFNGFGELLHERLSHADRSLYEVEYTRDALGRITERRETVEDETHTFRYNYDTAGRVIEALREAVAVERYAYDENGNRWRADGESWTSEASYDGQDRLLRYGEATYTYTANGNLLRRSHPAGTTEYDYDPLGNLLAVKLPNGRRIEYLVDGRGRRVGKQLDGTLVGGFLYQDSLRPIAALDGNGRVISHFVYASGANVPAYLIRDGSAYRIVSDHLGSPRLVVDAVSGEIAQRLDYDAFGNLLRDTNPGFQPFGFAGGLHDPDTGLVRFGVRDYDAETGRWTSKDPSGFQGGDCNLYGYVLGDPVNRKDPWGLYEPGPPLGGDPTFGGRISPLPPPSGYGVSIEFAKIIGEGGVYGLNVQYTPTEGWALYGYRGGGIGLSGGISAQANVAWGSGGWEGPFRSIQASGEGPGGEIFWSPPSPEGSWAGVNLGGSVGVPGLAYTETDYTCLWGCGSDLGDYPLPSPTIAPC